MSQVYKTAGVLLLSSNETAAKLILEGVEKHGLNIAWAKNERDSVKILGSQKYRIVVVDDDFCKNETLDYIGSLRNLLPLGTEFILLSNDPSIKIKDLHLIGVTCIMKKPMNIHQLVDHVGRNLGADGLRRFDGGQMHLDEFKNSFGMAFSQRKKHEHLYSAVSHLGRGGFFYETSPRNTLPGVGSVVNFEVTLTMVPNTKLAGKGVVRWIDRSDGKSGVGIEFLTLTADNEDFVVAFTDLFKVQEFVPVRATVTDTSH